MIITTFEDIHAIFVQLVVVSNHLDNFDVYLLTTEWCARSKLDEKKKVHCIIVVIIRKLVLTAQGKNSEAAYYTYFD